MTKTLFLSMLLMLVLAYDRFLLALKDTSMIGQQHVASKLEGFELSGFAETHFRDDVSPTDRTKIIHCLRDDVRTSLCCKEPDVNCLVLIMEQNGFTVSDFTESSIRITFRCFN